MALEHWIGVWLIVAAVALQVATTVLVFACLLALRRSMDGCVGGARRKGCRRSAGLDGTALRADGSARGDLRATSWPLGVIDINTARRWER